ncbi:hypothetical protein LTR53_001139 [Teratosphaeriaceae sp. CCFEE 6253]|nr:hypothetical protein LTR53_001139 [Teratosphaeriaceae sp. CCFEE 6253]
MHLMHTLDAEGKRQYTLKKIIDGEVTKSAHPARFSPDDKYSRHRVTLKKRYGLLITQQKDKKYTREGQLPQRDLVAALAQYEISEQLELDIAKSPTTALKQLLRQRFPIATSPCFRDLIHAIQNDTIGKYTSIGAGNAARSSNKPARSTHSKCNLEFSKVAAILKIDVRVPKCEGYVNKADKWWREHGHRFATAGLLQQDVLISERILPLPKPIRGCLINLTSVLGRSNRPRSKQLNLFKLRNFPLHVDQLEGVDVDRTPYAVAMARTLAVMHWRVECDADDVEFVLGGISLKDRDMTAEEFNCLPPQTTTMLQPEEIALKRPLMQLWMLDFNRVRVIEDDTLRVEAVVSAFYRNDPYFPRPLGDNLADQQFWEVFNEAYICTSRCLLVLEQMETEKSPTSRGYPRNGGEAGGEAAGENGGDGGG